ncbi:MAG: hypothetical protein K6F00_03845 [Lachnospiraceae bacterium]|nr:hypothetical protein [Lachnospiraceae bacterium]
MPTTLIVLIVIAVILIGAVVALYFLGKKAEKRQAEQDEEIAKNAQQVTMLIIDKKRLKIKESGLPEAVIKQAPWYSGLTKLPIVKAKAGPQIVTLICDNAIFDSLPVKREVKAMVSGLYITGFKGAHGKIEKPVEQKKGIRAWATRKVAELRKKEAK